MSNVHGLFSKRNDDNDNDDEEDHSNDRFVGGIGDRGGGSGLAVQPNTNDAPPGGNNPDALFQLAENATSDDRAQVRRTITMYRDGFTVDDGPYRRVDDPANADFLRALAMGRAPRELTEENDGGEVVVGLVDKRKEDYVEEFRSFSGQGTSLGSATTNTDASATDVFDAATLTAQPAPTVNSDAPTTAIQVRLSNGQRRVVRLNLDMTVQHLAAHAAHAAGDSSLSFRLVSGFPPKPLPDPSATIEAAGLKGAQVSMQKV